MDYAAYLILFEDTEVNALTQSDPYQIVSFPAKEKLYWCAITTSARALLIGHHTIQFFKPSAPSDPFASNDVTCASFQWAGTIAGAEVFYHQRNPECNCPDKASLPCPPGIQLIADGDLSSIMAPFGSYFLSGRDYADSVNAP